MRKIFWCFISLNSTLLYPTETNSVPTLQELSIDAVRKSTHDPEIKENYREALKNSTIDWIQYFKSKDNVIGDFDFSEFNLSNIDLRGCTLNKTNFSKTDFRKVKLKNTVFNEVNLNKVDLRGIFSNPENFKGCLFKNVNLEDALLYGEKPEEYFYLKGNTSPHNLLRQYADLIKKEKLEQDQNKKDLLHKQTETFKTLLTNITLDLIEYHLTVFDLTELYLTEHTKFNNLTLTELMFNKSTSHIYLPIGDVFSHLIPEFQNIQNCNRKPLFNLWRNGNEEQKKLMQIFINCGINLIKGVELYELKNVDWSKENLENASLSWADLIEANLTGANLTEANLTAANLTEANLTEANLERAKLERAKLTAANLTEANLERANLESANLTGAKLTRAKLTEAKLMLTNLKGADLTDANLTGATLWKVDLTGAKLKGADLKNSLFYCVKLSDTVSLWENPSTEELQKIYEDTSHDLKVRTLAKQIAIAKGFSIENWDNPN